ncbi:ArsR family transcriptional regulator [Actinorhabdospora filicis]|uniref:ArsR family transcriptional regulator n=1 Tax=Actinorhabdospora filicis TaxID=1785913 RepID=A0A9W6SP83_9ACTN|nr:helix-turn-helix domain-containing protein [Actinorhabdospora filicis]GLZ79572.1 ArsR family transcriptional regulator [Actinorhabdospora filicis]
MEDTQLAAVAALDEPNRRRLYEYVARQPEPVGRDEAAAAVGLARATAAFHLDRLVEQGLLDVDYRRLTGRSGPGAGRTAKVYRRSGRQFALSLPARSYELAARLLAAAVEESDATGAPARQVLERLAREAGRAMAGDGELVRVLEENGFEPRAGDDGIALGNCPFHALAAEHGALVCGMNLRLLEGIAEGRGYTVGFDTGPGACCVRLDPGAR